MATREEPIEPLSTEHTLKLNEIGVKEAKLIADCLLLDETITVTSSEITDSKYDEGLIEFCQSLSKDSCRIRLIMTPLNSSSIKSLGIRYVVSYLSFHNFCNLTTLILENNNIGDEGLKEICEVLTLPHCKFHLSCVNLASTGITEEGVFWLCNFILHPSCTLSTLNLNSNQIGDIGITRLCNSISHPTCKIQLKELHIEDTNITENGINSLNRLIVHPSCSLTNLCISRNMNIGPKGFSSLCRALVHNISIVNLGVANCGITDHHKNQLRCLFRIYNSPIMKLNIDGNEITNSMSFLAIARNNYRLFEVKSIIYKLYFENDDSKFKIHAYFDKRMMETFRGLESKINFQTYEFEDLDYTLLNLTGGHEFSLSTYISTPDILLWRIHFVYLIIQIQNQRRKSKINL